MKKLLAVLLAAFLAVPLLRAATAEADLAALQALVAAKAPADLTTGSARFHWAVKHSDEVTAAAEKFLTDHPADPLRWEAAQILLSRSRLLVKASDDAKLDAQRPGTVVIGAVEYDREAQEKWRERLAVLDAQCAAATDMPPALRQKYEIGAISRRISAATLAVTKKQPVDFAPIRAEVDRIIAAYPEAPQSLTIFNAFLNLRRRSGAAIEDINKLLQEYAESPCEGVRTAAESDLTLYRAQEHPLDWKFTAADGREVDLAKLRGKVVLIDFWATWCHPCIAEIPNVVANYNKYHDQGFEVVGMTLENAGVPPNAPPEAAAAKLAASKQKMLAFTQEKGMPWPQYFDGTGWKNPYTAKYGIHGIPRMFLLDQEGKVVTMDARGPKLESEIKRLLKL